MKFIYKITLVLLLVPLVTAAKVVKKKHEKSKVIKKEFVVNTDAKVALNNRYGNLNITTWNQNRVEIEVTITVKGNDIEDIEDRLSTIDVAFNASSSLIEAKTIFEKKNNNWSWWKKNDNINYKINYVVKMPKSNSVDLDNDYGSIYLDNLEGNADISCDYGKIDIGELSAENNRIKLEYCSTSSIRFMKSGDINVDYSKITLDKTQKVRVNADYSAVRLGEANNVDFNSDYGPISIQEAERVHGNSDYASMRFGEIKEELIIETDYGSISVDKLAKGFKNVDIDGQYAGIKIGVENGAAFNFEIDLQYAGLNRGNDQIEFLKKISKNTSKYYEGKYGKGSSSARLKIRSQYGGVSLKEY